MKPLKLKNFEELDMLLVIGPKIYGKHLYTLSGTTTFSVGGRNSSNVSVTIKGDVYDFDNAIHTQKLEQVLVVKEDGTTKHATLCTYYIKTPSTFNGVEFTLELDTLPKDHYVGITSPYNEQLPISWGLADVVPVNVSKQFIGTLLQTVSVVPLEEINSIFDSYLKLVRVLKDASYINSSPTTLSELEAYSEYINTIRGFQDKYPEHFDTLEPFYSLPDFIGITETALIKESVVGTISNLGLRPPISLFSCIYSDTQDDLILDYKTQLGTNIQDPYEMLYENKVRDVTMSLSSIQSEILTAINSMRTLPNALSIDLGTYVGDVSLKINGLVVDGNYKDRVLTDVTYGFEAVNVLFTASSEQYAIILDDKDFAKRGLVNKFLLIDFETWQCYCRVTKQIGVKLYLDSTPLKLVCNATTPIASYKIGDVYLTLLQKGTIKGISDSFESFMPISEFVRSPMPSLTVNSDGSYTCQGMAVDLLETPAFFIKTDTDVLEEVYWSEKILTFPSEVKSYYVSYYDTSGNIIDYESDEFDELSQVSYKQYDGFTFTHNHTFYWRAEYGSDVELNDIFSNIYIVDVEPNKYIRSVSCKVGADYVIVPSDWYEVIPNFEYVKSEMTAIKISIPFSSRAAYSDDILVQTGDPELKGNYGLSYDTLYLTIVNIANRLGLTVKYLGDVTKSRLATFKTSYAVYGFNSAIDVIHQLLEEARCGYYISNNYVVIKELDIPATPDDLLDAHLIDLNNIDSFQLSTSDANQLYYNILFSWNSYFNKVLQFFATVTRADDSLIYTNQKEIKTLRVEDVSLKYAKFFLHRYGRNWYKLIVSGFIDSLKLDPYDKVKVILENLNTVLGEVQACTYNHETSVVTLEIILSLAVYGTTDVNPISLWEPAGDIDISYPTRALGYTLVNNIKMVAYYD